MSKIALYKILKKKGMSARAFAAHTSGDDRLSSVGRSKFGAILNGEKPTLAQKKTIEDALDKLDLPIGIAWKTLTMAELQKIETHGNNGSNKNKPKEVLNMAGRRLTPNTIDRFKITDKGRRAFIPRIDTENVYRSPEYVKLEETLIEAIKEQDTFCLIGPRGCGKSTLLNATVKKHFPENGGKYAVKIIRLFNADIAKTTVQNILVALCRGAGTKIKGGNREDQSWFTHKALTEMRKSSDSVRPVLIIEDAHLLHVKILVALKRLMEMETEAGERALGIIMLAQEPMGLKMGPGTEQLWERCYTVEFKPLVPGKASKLTARHLAPLKGYIEFRLQLAGLDPAETFDGNTLNNICKLIADDHADYPLMVNNYLIARLNQAASTEKDNPKITMNHIGSMSEVA